MSWLYMMQEQSCVAEKAMHNSELQKCLEVSLGHLYWVIYNIGKNRCMFWVLIIGMILLSS